MKGGELWYCTYRKDWIEEMLRVYGFINREHLQRKFGISTPQASKWLQDYMRERPGRMFYNPNLKRYEPIMEGLARGKDDGR